MFRFIVRELLGKSLVLLILLALATWFGGLWLDQQIFTPNRNYLHSFHLERLQNPAEFGIKIHRHECLEGKVPCLLVEPDAVAGPGARGKVLREQLQDRGVGLPEYGETHTTLVMLHGRNGRKESLLAVAERFVAAGFRCIIPDLPAHGDSRVATLTFGGNYFEQQLPSKVLEEVREHFELPEEPAALWGMSMGGAVALHTATKTPELWQGVVVVSSFSALDEVLLHLMPDRYQRYSGFLLGLLDISRQLRGLPTVSAIRPVDWAKQLTLPALVVHGERDYYVPLEHGREIYQAIPHTHKRWVSVPGGGHRNVLSTPKQLYADMSVWLLELKNQK